MHGEEEVEYKHPVLETILAETYGIIVYQEQIIQTLTPGRLYTGEADLVRRAIGKKKASDIEKHKKIFVAGCGRNGIDRHRLSITTSNSLRGMVSTNVCRVIRK